MKKGQVTLFIILGIIIVIFIVLGFAFRNQLLGVIGLSGEITYPEEVQEIVDHVQDCVDDSAYAGVVNIGLKGGYYTLPEASFNYGLTSLPYYYYAGNNIMPSLNDVENEINNYMEFEVFYCADFSEFSEFNISAGEISVNSVINNNSVDILVNYPLDVIIDEAQYNFNDPFETTVDANLGWLLSIAENIVEHDIENPDEIDLQFLLDQGLARVSYVPFDNETIVYLLEDTTSFEGDENYTLMFASYYPIPEEYYEMESMAYWEMFI